jgi:hypothetical protein
MQNFKHLPYLPVFQPPYNRESLDHPQNFVKSGLMKVMVNPAENCTFVAGGEIYGRMDVSCKGDGGHKGKCEILVGELGIELTGYDGTPFSPHPPHSLSSFS